MKSHIFRFDKLQYIIFTIITVMILLGLFAFHVNAEQAYVDEAALDDYSVSGHSESESSGESEMSDSLPNDNSDSTEIKSEVSNERSAVDENPDDTKIDTELTTPVKIASESMAEASEPVAEASEPVAEASEPVTAVLENFVISRNMENENVRKLAHHEVIVKTFDELSKALSNDNGYTVIYLGADITMGSSVIVPHANKIAVFIDGISPLEPGVIHTLTDSTSGNNIRVNSNNGIKNIVMRNMTIVGRNSNGTVNVVREAKNVNVIFQNVTYTGPQMHYNVYGTLILDNCDITITAANGGSSAQEVAETANVFFRNNVTIKHTPSPFPVFSCTYQDGYITVDAGANVNIEKTSGGGFYSSFKNFYFHDFTIRSGGKFTYTNTSIKSTNIGMTQTAFSSFTVETGGEFYMSTSSAATDALMKVQGPVSVAKDTIFEIVGKSTYGSIYITDENTLSLNDPKLFLIHNSTGRTIRYERLNTLSITGEQINIWTTAGSGDINNLPLYGWRKAHKDSFFIRGTLQPGKDGNFSSISSNYSDGDAPGSAPSTENFVLNSTRVLSVGDFSLSIIPPYEGDHTISGITGANAAIVASYTIDGMARSYSTTADNNGGFSIELDEVLLVDTEIKVRSNNNRYLFAEETVLVLQAEGELYFTEMPKDIHFGQGVISAQYQIIPRLDTNYALHVTDSRAGNQSWKLTAILLKELAPEMEGLAPPVPGAVIFIDDTGITNPLGTDEAVLIYNSTHAKPEEVTLVWPQNKGFLLQIYPGDVRADIPYTAVIQWNLTDAP